MEEKKNLLLFTGCNEILHYTANQIAMAYQQMGWNVFCVSPKQEYVVKVMEILRRGIDRVLCLNNVGWLLDYKGSNLYDVLGIESFNYILDHPLFYMSTLKQAPKLGTVLCVDRNHVDYIKRYYKDINQALFLPLAGDKYSGVSSK